MLVDTHTHLNFKAFKEDWKEVVKKSIKTGVEKMIVVGTDLESSKRALEMAEHNSAIYASVGVHPHHARGLLEEIPRLSGSSHRTRGARDDKLALKSLASLSNKLEKLVKHKEVVAIGEVGLDYHQYQSTKYPATMLRASSKLKNLQKRLLGMTVEIAKKLNKPLIIHSREASDDVLDVIEHFSKRDGKLPSGVFHCFDGGKKYLKKILAAGFYTGFTGNVTYASDRAEVANDVPLDRLLLETDCPFMPPRRTVSGQTNSKKRARNLRSTPGDVKIIAEFHAIERGISVSEVSRETSKNAQRLFGF